MLASSEVESSDASEQLLACRISHHFQKVRTTRFQSEGVLVGLVLALGGITEDWCKMAVKIDHLASSARYDSATR